MTLLLAVVGGGLLLGVLVAAISAPLRGSARIVATPLPSAAGAARGGAAGAGTDAGGTEAAAPGAGAAAQNPGAAAGTGGQSGAGRGGAGAQGSGGAQGGAARGGGAASGAAGGPTASGARGAGAAGAAVGRTNGVVDSIVDGTMIVNTPDGPVRVTLGDGTTVQRVQPADRADLAPGQRVVISGDRGGDGAVAANGVQILPGDGGPTPGERDQEAGRGGPGTQGQTTTP